MEVLKVLCGSMTQSRKVLLGQGACLAAYNKTVGKLHAATSTVVPRKSLDFEAEYRSEFRMTNSVSRLYAEDDALPISGLQHLVFCERNGP